MTEMPVFVKVEEYKEVINIISSIRSKIEDARTALKKVQDLKNEEDAELELWQSAIDDVERKVEFVDSTLSEPESL